jgi:hypothetical protein
LAVLGLQSNRLALARVLQEVQAMKTQNNIAHLREGYRNAIDDVLKIVAFPSGVTQQSHEAATAVTEYRAKLQQALNKMRPSK